MSWLNLFQNTNEMYDVFENAQRIAVSHVTTMMIEEVQDEIKSLGIGSGFGNSVYEPTGEFEEDAWVGDTINEATRNRISQFVEAQMGYDPMRISTIDSDNFIHGSFSEQDYRKYLPDTIFGGNSSPLWGGGWWTKPRDAWSKSIKQFEKKWGKWVKEGFAISGIYLS
jgi:hypothetical protein